MNSQAIKMAGNLSSVSAYSYYSDGHVNHRMPSFTYCNCKTWWLVSTIDCIAFLVSHNLILYNSIFVLLKVSISVITYVRKQWIIISYQVLYNRLTNDFLLPFPMLAEKVQGQPQERALKKNRRFRERATRTNAMSLSGWLLRPASISCLLR